MAKTKIAIVSPNPARWYRIVTLFEKTIADLGYTIVPHKEADLVIGVQRFQDLERNKNKLYVLVQTEQVQARPGLVKQFLQFNPDHIWGFDKEKEDYLILGYHPALECTEHEQKKFLHDILFVGAKTARREAFFAPISSTLHHHRSWDHHKLVGTCRTAKINLNVHAYCATNYTEWDRLMIFLANKIFFISENLYCPLPVAQFGSTPHALATMVQHFLNHPEERSAIADSLYNLYKTAFDMRNILQEKLRKL